jgi:hypothetical protein
MTVVPPWRAATHDSRDRSSRVWVHVLDQQVVKLVSDFPSARSSIS